MSLCAILLHLPCNVEQKGVPARRMYLVRHARLLLPGAGFTAQGVLQ